MTTLESLQFYTKILTGMVLLLNIGLLVSIRMALKFARLTCAEDRSEDGARRWDAIKRTLAVLIVTVVCMNGGAVFANHRLVSATHDIASQVPQDTDAELVLNVPMPAQPAAESK
jgi:hypothetical protein